MIRVAIAGAAGRMGNRCTRLHSRTPAINSVIFQFLFYFFYDLDLV